MKIVKAIYETRGPVPQDVINAVESDCPPLATGQALVEILAAPINPSDVLTLTGEYGFLPPLPAIGGAEGVGRVIELGPDTAGPPVGQTVLLPVGVGTWASHAVAPAAKLTPLPNTDPKQLSMISVNPPTAALLLSDFVTLKPGDWVIQNAANSGVGGYLVQMAKIRGFKTVNVVRRDSAVAPVQAQGGDVVLVDGDDLAKRVKEATGGADIRLAIDAVGGKATERIATCLGEAGTVVNYGAMGGEPCLLSPRNLVFKDVTLRGFWLAKWFRTAAKPAQMALYGELAQHIAAGRLSARIHATYPVSRIKEAIIAANSGERDGKVLIAP